jgi:hypothetical protein
MRKLLVALAVAALFAGCGDNDNDPAAKAATPAPSAPAERHELDLEGYSEGVQRYYGGARPHEGGDDLASVEAEYHQPPEPPEASAGETITLTGTNIGVRMEVTLKSVKPSADRTEVRLRLENTGIAVYEGPLQHAQLTYAGGDAQAALTDETCSRGFDTGLLRIDVSEQRNVCLLFPGGEAPERLQLALEQVPAEAGGIWKLPS